jgi:hypothetical protein
MHAGRYLTKILKEPPFRLLAKALYGVLPVSVATRSLWDLSARPAISKCALRATGKPPLMTHALR